MSGLRVVAAVVAVARERQLTVDAAGLGFYAFNLSVALVVLVYTVLTLFGGVPALSWALEALTGVGSFELQRLVEEFGGDAAGRRRAAGLASGIAAWSSLRLFRAIESVFADVYGTRSERSLVRQLFDSVLVLVVVTLTVAALAVLGSAFLFRTGGRAWAVAGPLALWLSLVVLFLPVYYGFSGAGVSATEVLPGAVLAAGGWTVATIGLRVYVGVSESVDLFGIVGAVLLVLTWLYVAGLSLLVGVVLNAVLAGRIEADREWHPFAG